LEAIKSIFRESVDRENILLQREQSLDVRESLLTSTYYATMERASGAEVKQQSAPPIVNDEELVTENQNLKAELYELRAEKRRGFQHSTREHGSGKQSGEENEGSEEEEGGGETYSSDDDQEGEGGETKKQQGPPGTGAAIKSKSTSTVKVNRQEYEALLKNYAELEVGELDSRMHSLIHSFFRLPCV
jgi:hypothetical protein